MCIRDRYHSAAALAEQAGDIRDQSLAQSHLADALDSAGNASDAAMAYQKAIALDEQLKDPRAEAVDWFNYGQFLARHSLPGRLAYASYCLLYTSRRSIHGPIEFAVRARF